MNDPIDRINPGSINALSRRVVMVAALTVGALVAWAASAQLDEKTIATGRIIPAGQIRQVQHLEGGIVSTIYVREGESVKAGQPLIEFNSSKAQAERDRTATRRASLLIESQRLGAQLQDRVPVFSNVDPQLEGVRRAQLALFQAQKATWHSALTALQAKLNMQDATVSRTDSELRSQRRHATLIQKEVTMREKLTLSGAGTELDLIHAQAAVETSRVEIARLESSLIKVQESMLETQQRITDLDNQYRDKFTQQLSDISTQLAELDQLMHSLDDRVERLVVVAPVNAVVQTLMVKSPGEVLSPGGVIAELVPADEELVAETEISPKDIGFVSPGQAVSIKVNAYDFSRFGDVDGVLHAISASTFVRDDGSVYYRGKVKLARNYIGENSSQKNLLPGMTLQAEIRTGSKTLLQYILKPIYTNLEQGFAER